MFSQPTTVDLLLYCCGKTFAFTASSLIFMIYNDCCTKRMRIELEAASPADACAVRVLCASYVMRAGLKTVFSTWRTDVAQFDSYNYRYSLTLPPRITNDSLRSATRPHRRKHIVYIYIY